MADEKPIQAALTSPDIPGSGIEATFTNRFWAYANPSIVRLIFGDSAGGIDLAYHSAVVMQTSDAKELAALLIRLIAQVESTPQPPAGPTDG